MGRGVCVCAWKGSLIKIRSYNSCNKKSEAEESINACVISDVTDGRLTSALWRQQASRDQTVDKVAVFIRDTTLRPNQGVITCKNVYKTIWMDAAGDTGGKQLTCLQFYYWRLFQKAKDFGKKKKQVKFLPTVFSFCNWNTQGKPTKVTNYLVMLCFLRLRLSSLFFVC